MSNKLVWLGFVVCAQSWGANEGSPVNETSPSQAMVKIEDILVQKAGALNLVPAEAARDQDFITFMTALHGRDRADRLRPLARAFENEYRTTGLNPYELYSRMKLQLDSVRSVSEMLYGVLFPLSLGGGHQSTQICANVQGGMERGLRFGVGLGVEKRGRWYLPILTLRCGHFKNPVQGEMAAGLMVDSGVESRSSSDIPKIVNFTESQMTGIATVVGWTGMECNRDGESLRYNGVAIGGSYHCNTNVKGMTVKIPLFFPIPGRNPFRKAMRLQTKIIGALQHFDLTGAAAAMVAYRIEVNKAVQEGRNLGLSPQNMRLEEGHPLQSPGNLFAGSALVAYSPDLAPDLMGAYRPNVSRFWGVRRVRACEAPLLEIEATSVSDQAARPLPE
jgi:hypothetical protein